MYSYPGAVSTDISSNVLDELLANLELSFPLLSSVKPNLRQLSTTVILSLMKSVVPASCPEFYIPVKQTIATMLQKAFDECIEKKNHRISLKLFEDCLVRNPEFIIRTLLSRLIQGTVNGKTPYLRSECCKLVSVILKKKDTQFEEKDNDTSSFIIKECLQLTKNIGSALSSTSDSTSGVSRKESDHRTKRIKPILLCIKDLSILLKTQQSKAKKGPVITATAELTKAVKTAVTMNSNLKPLADQILSNLGQTSLSSNNDHDSDSDGAIDTKSSSKDNDNNEKGKSTKRKKIVSEVEAMRDWGLEDRSDRAVKKSSKKARRTQS